MLVSPRGRSAPGFIGALSLVVLMTWPAHAQKPDPEIEQYKAWGHEVQQSLIAGKVDDLDRIATTLRLEKTRLPGGGWKLAGFYSFLATPEGVDANTQDHLSRLEAWVKLRPESLAARVALATSLLRWAWIARGNESAKNTPKEAFALFFDRLSRARAALEGSEKLAGTGPEWYHTEMQVGLAQQVPLAQEREWMERGLQLEPDYYLLENELAKFELPKWYGAPGDSTKLAAALADQRGGEAGDRLYFQVIASILTRENEGSMGKLVDWPRVQRGYAVLTREFGVTRLTRNEYAYMAGRCEDVATVRAQLALIGEDWAPSVWLSRAYFDRVRDWARDQSE